MKHSKNFDRSDHFSIGHFHLRWYSLILSIAMLIGGWLAIRERFLIGCDFQHWVA